MESDPSVASLPQDDIVASLPQDDIVGSLPQDDSVARLRGAVEEYAHILAALGHDARGVSELVQQALREAGDVSPPLATAVADWSSAAANRP